MKLWGKNIPVALLMAGRIALLIAFILPYLTLTVATAQKNPLSRAVGTGHQEIRAVAHHVIWSTRPITVTRRHLPLTVPFLTDKEVECLLIGIPSYRSDEYLFDDCRVFRSLTAGFFHSLPDRAPPVVA